MDAPLHSRQQWRINTHTSAPSCAPYLLSLVRSTALLRLATINGCSVLSFCLRKKVPGNSVRKRVPSLASSVAIASFVRCRVVSGVFRGSRAGLDPKNVPDTVPTFAFWSGQLGFFLVPQTSLRAKRTDDGDGRVKKGKGERTFFFYSRVCEKERERSEKKVQCDSLVCV